MTINGVISLLEDVKPSQLSRERLIGWLSELDGRFFNEIILTHERGKDTPDTFIPYTLDTDGERQLLIPDPYSEVYRWYLSMQIDLANMEMDKYNNSLMMFTPAWEAYARKYHREHMPIQRVKTWKY